VTEERVRVSKFEKQLEETWSLVDELFDSMSAEDWQRKHGPDWIFADLPWHIHYIDQDFVVIPTRKGGELPVEERLSFPSTSALNEWNDAMLASRPADQSVQQSLEMMRSMRAQCRDLISEMTDASLDEKAWFPLVAMRGWRTMETPANFCFNHTFGHFMEAKIRLKRPSPQPSPDLVHARISGIMNLMERAINKEKAAETKLTIGMNFTGPGGGSWTIDVDNGSVSVEERSPGNPDFVMTQSPETFEAFAVKAVNPIWAMLTGRIKVKGLRNIGPFMSLIAPPSVTEVIEPI
jgi:putative sterol carrier protein